MCTSFYSTKTAPDLNRIARLPMAKNWYRLVPPQGKTYLAVVDYFSRYPEIQTLSTTTSNSIITALKNIFSRLGIPEVVVSDNGPQYSSHEFVEFAKAYHFKHVTSSPLYAPSSGQMERTIQTVRRLIKESKDPHMVLLAYRTTPFPWCKLSPAELLMGRRLHSNLPIIKEQLLCPRMEVSQ